ncbi:MAG: hypothetical protein QGI08_00095 [Paracoccaceae bacterium]|nr:hypothetical protein [Paracoccaceae bacterium]MDP7184102.1 hypothetical protein [Paracoccaceae bacterium]
MKQEFSKNGFAVYDADPQIAAWAKAAMPLAQAALQDAKLRDDWLRCEGTWFVGVDALATGPEGQAGSTPLAGDIVDDLHAYTRFARPLHKAQLSAVFPGYPKPREGETESAFAYRLRRDAAHVDGLHAIGQGRRRHLIECHAFLLGICLTDCSDNASPLVVWRGSHHVIRSALSEALGTTDASDWHKVDLTDAYHAARRRCFAECERVELPIKPGQALVMHRHALHGIAPWGKGAKAPEQGRMIAYFRPEIEGAPEKWLRSL